MILIESLKHMFGPRSNNTGIPVPVDSFPYEEPYSHLNHIDIHKKLDASNSVSAMVSCFQPFINPNDGYTYNLAWMKHKWDKLKLAIISAYFSDIHTYNECYPSIQTELRSLDLLIINLLPYYERKDIYDILSTCFKQPGYTFGKSVSPVQIDLIYFLRNRNILSFLENMGVHLDIEGPDFVSHTDYSHWYTNVSSTRLSRAVQRNDLDLVAFLLSCGANPNATLSFTVQRSSNSSMAAHHLLLDVENPTIFRLLMKHGMHPYPTIGYNDSKTIIENKMDHEFRRNTPSQEMIDVLCEYHISMYDLTIAPFFADRNIRSAAKNIDTFVLWKSRLKELYRNTTPIQMATVGDTGYTIEFLTELLKIDPTNRKALYHLGKLLLEQCNACLTKELSHKSFVVLSTLHEYVYDDEYRDLEHLLSHAHQYYRRFHDTP